jgi:hypothetical protein
MGIKQISVFLENTTDRLCDVTQTLAKAGVNLRAINIADTADFGILRIVADKTEEAVNALSAAGFTTRQTTVAAVEIEDKPGSLASLLELFLGSGINIAYLYSSLEGGDGKAVVIFKLEDHEKGFEILKKSGVTLAEKF